jgi:hypothetical protein
MDEKERTLLDMVSFMEKTDKINRGLLAILKLSLVTIMVICLLFAFVICYRDHAYFFSEYAYPEVQLEQEVNQSDGDLTQEVKQNIK